MIICPNCGVDIQQNNLNTCTDKDCLPSKFGIHRLLKKNFAKKLLAFEENFKNIREQEGLRFKSPAIYERLPYISKKEGNNLEVWKAFRTDLKNIKYHLSQKENLNILNYGSWNGWLSNNLVKWGHRVTAISYFSDEYDGLGAQQFYKNNWLSIQMDIEHNLDIIDEKYDCIILNRGVGYLEQPQKTILELMGKLAPNGILFITGLNVYKDDKIPHQKMADFRAYHKTKYDFPIYFTQSKGYLSANDIKKLKKLGVKLYPHSNKIVQKIKMMLSPKRPYICYGVLET